MSIKLVAAEEQMVGALKKSITSSNYKIVISTKRQNEEGESLCSLITCDGNEQVMAYFFAKVEGVKDDTVVICGPEMGSVVLTMSEIKKPIEMEVLSDMVKFTCGSAVVPVGVKVDTEIKEIPPQMDEKTVALRVKSADLKRAISKGAFRPCKDDSRSLMNLVQLSLFKREGEALCFRVLTSDTYSVVCADISVDAVKPAFSQEIHLGIACDRLNSVCGLLMEEDTDIFLNTDQVIIRNGNDFYIFRTFANKYPSAISALLEVRDFGCKATVSIKELETAIALASLTNNNENKPVILSQKSNKVVVTDQLKKSVVELETTLEGDFEPIGLRAGFLKSLLSKINTEKVTLGISNPASPCYCFGEDVGTVSLMLPINLDIQKD